MFNTSMNFIRMLNRENLFKLEFSNFVGNKQYGSYEKKNFNPVCLKLCLLNQKPQEHGL